MEQYKFELDLTVDPRYGLLPKEMLDMVTGGKLSVEECINILLVRVQDALDKGETRWVSHHRIISYIRNIGNCALQGDHLRAAIIRSICHIVYYVIYYRETPARTFEYVQAALSAWEHVKKVIIDKRLGTPHVPTANAAIMLAISNSVSDTVESHGTSSLSALYDGLDYEIEKSASCVCPHSLRKDTVVMHLREHWERDGSLYEHIAPLVHSGVIKNEGVLKSLTELPTVLVGDCVYTYRDKFDAFRNRVRTCSLSTYLVKDLALSQTTVRDIINLRKSYDTLKFAKTPSEVAAVYERGPSSCMSYTVDEYRTNGTRPTEVYGTGEGGDVAVAYIGDIDGTVRARAVVNMNDKLYPSYYGHGSMESILKEAGFSQACRALHGCRILSLFNDEGCRILPYIDGDCYGVDVITCDGSTIEVDCDHEDGEYSGDYETGLMRADY